MNDVIKLIKEKFEISGVRALENFIIVEKFNWDYLDCLKFQEWCVDFVYNNESSKIDILIFTNHPSCFTLGRGLQKKVTDPVELVDFCEDHKKKLTIPVYDIKRGGGLTFHHPGQVIIYPIINLTRHKLKVYSLMNNIMKIATRVLMKFGAPSKLDYCRDLLGLWYEDKKLASIGLQVRRFITFHGMALNLKSDKLVNENLSYIYPCGLPGSWYSSVDTLFSEKISAQDFTAEFSCNLDDLFSECKK